MVAEFKTNSRLPAKVREIYDWLELEIRSNAEQAGNCQACGRCCDLESFEHRLFVTSPEMMYLAANIGVENFKSMPGSRCPYNTYGKCSIYEYRFAGCRIFCCKGSPDFQSNLSESVLRKFKDLCEQLQIPYRYVELSDALNSFAGKKTNSKKPRKV